MNAKASGWAIGARVYVVHNYDRRWNKDFWATVVKVGREWVTVQPDDTEGEWAQEKFHFDTLRLKSDGYVSKGRVFPSKDVWEQTQTRNQEWEAMLRRLNFTPPDHLTLEDVRKIAAMVLPAARPTTPGTGEGE